MTLSTLRVIAVAIVLLPAAGFAQTPAAAPPAATPALSRTDAMRVDQRIKLLHDQLGVTSAEQAQWDQYAQVMRENAAVITHAGADRAAKLDGMTAVATMQSYADLAKLHGENMEKLAAAFTTLYGSLSPAQKQKADTLFRVRAESRAAARARPS